MMIAVNSRAHKGRWNMEEFEERRRGMVQPSQQHVAPCVKGDEWELGTRGLSQIWL